MPRLSPIAASLGLGMGFVSGLVLLLATMTSLSVPVAIGVGIAIGGMAALGLSLVQRWFMSRGMRNNYPVAELQHPELGRVTLYRCRWESAFDTDGPLAGCAISSRSSSGTPSDAEISLWRAIRDAQQQVLTNACQAASAAGNMVQAEAAASNFWPALLRLEPPNAFTLFLGYCPPREEQPMYVRFRDMVVVNAGRTPLRE